MTAEPKLQGPKRTGPKRSGIEYFESLQYLEGQKFAPIESAARLLAALGNPQDKVPAVHVAGTNGKGSVSAMIASMLMCEGYHVGQTSSPHLVSVAERCLVDGSAISETDFGAAIEEVVAVSEREEIVPSYFVLGIVVAFLEFARRKLDWMVVEVGLGGKLDATNLIRQPRVSVITGISADHVEILGPGIEDIARKKAGIAKPGAPLLVGRVSEQVEAVIRETAGELGAPVEVLGRDFFYDEASDGLSYGRERRPAYTDKLQLPGAHQKLNAVLAARVGYLLGLSEKSVSEGLRRARWPGRLEWLTVPEYQVPVLMDVAHNVEGVEALCCYLRSQKISSFVIVLSILRRKDWRGMMSCFRELLPGKKLKWIFTHSGYPGALDPADLQTVVGEGEVEPVPERALEKALQACGPGSAVLITGSVFLVGRLRPLLTKEPLKSIAPP